MNFNVDPLSKVFQGDNSCKICFLRGLPRWKTQSLPEHSLCVKIDRRCNSGDIIANLMAFSWLHDSICV